MESVDTGDLKSPGSDTVRVRVPSAAPDCIWRQCVTNSADNRALPLGNDGSDMDCPTAPRKASPKGLAFLDVGGRVRESIDAADTAVD